MKILLTGVTGYIGKRMATSLVNNGHEVICCVRDTYRVSLPASIMSKVRFLQFDFLDPPDLNTLPKDIDGAYYLIHSMSQSIKEFADMEARAAETFRDYMHLTKVKHVIYLSGIINGLKDRKSVV